MLRVAVIRHHGIDSAGFISDAFEARGAALAVHLFPDDGPLPALDGADHLVVLGAVSSVNDPDPWIAEELAWLRRADTAGVPVLGICFGAQALCAALGGRVETMERKEIGWTLVESADHELIPAGPWLEFHGDRCLPPAAAVVLARNDAGVQAFRLGRHLAFQFHPEVDGPQLKRWLDADESRDAERLGLDPDQFLADTIREEPAGAGAGRPPGRHRAPCRRRGHLLRDVTIPTGRDNRGQRRTRRVLAELPGVTITHYVIRTRCLAAPAARGPRLDEVRDGPPAHQGRQGQGRHVRTQRR